MIGAAARTHRRRSTQVRFSVFPIDYAIKCAPTVVAAPLFAVFEYIAVA